LYTTRQIPIYPNRKGFVPLDVEDFADGGAYPDVQVDEAGKLRTDLIVKQGGNRNRIVQSQMSDIKEKEKDEVTICIYNIHTYIYSCICI
jgi:hypothetical protein